MTNNINDPHNKERIAIVAVGYNRRTSLTRLLDSLNNALYDTDDIPLVISIDASGDQKLYDFVESFEWRHGVKYVNIQQERLGLKAHILQCGDLTKFFKAIALFEDDLWVSPYYYNYLKEAVERYGNNKDVCEISLYRNESLGSLGFYFDVLHDGSDCFLWQDISTWGECWTEQMWKGFREWISIHDEEYINKTNIPEKVKKWSRAWSRYYIAYCVDTHKYVVFPHESLTTNFNDAGGEHGGGSNVVQVNVQYGKREYQMREFNSLVRYDIYSNCELLYEWLPENVRGQVCLDLYGSRINYGGKRYVLSMKNLPYSRIRTWGLAMRPIELNVLYGVVGEGVSLYDTSITAKGDGNYNREVVPYMLRGFNPRLLLKYVIRFYSQLFLKKLKK